MSVSDKIDEVISILRHKLTTEHYDFHYDYTIEARDRILAIIEERYNWGGKA